MAELGLVRSHDDQRIRSYLGHNRAASFVLIRSEYVPFRTTRLRDLGEGGRDCWLGSVNWRWSARNRIGEFYQSPFST